MSLANEIRVLRNQTLIELNEAHDYFIESSFVWDLLRTGLLKGKNFRKLNLVTGNRTNASDLVRKSQTYVTRELPESTFQLFISIFESFIFESFIFDFLKRWLSQYPQSLIGKQVDFKTVLDSADKEAIVEVVVGKELNEVLYERPAGWFAYLQGKVKLGHPSSDEIGRFSEAKATRDTLVHNRGIANKNYLAKSGSLARYQMGERLEISEKYHRDVWELLCKMVTEISDDALAKV